MGLLTNPKTREKISHIISRYNNKLCCLSYLVGLGWFLALAYQPLNAGTYFSENALLPGMQWIQAGISGATDGSLVTGWVGVQGENLI